MFRFDPIKPGTQEVVQEREVSKEALRHVFFYSLLEIERLRNHILNLESEIDHEGDLFLLMNLGERRGHTGKSIECRKQLTRKLLPVILGRILDSYTKRDDADRWDLFILFNEDAIERYLSGEITYLELVKAVISR